MCDGESFNDLVRGERVIAFNDWRLSQMSER